MAFRPGHASQQRECKRYTVLVFEFPVQRQALLKQGLCAITVALDESQSRRNDERLRLHGCLDPLTCCQGALQQGPPCASVPMYCAEASPAPPQTQCRP